ncbi:MAG: hypothetical protein ACJ8KX_01920 [Chthoniobacterales bacterium]
MILLLACVINVSCYKGVTGSETPPFRIIATDVGFEAPKSVPSGLRHIMYENHGSQIHEAMLVKLPQGTSAEDYVAEVKKGSLFPKGAMDYSGPGLTSPGETAEMWLRVDPGEYILICWNDGHAKSTPVHPFTVEYTRSDDPAPKEDLVLRLRDYQFDLVGNLRKGSQVIRVETPGPAMHEVDFYRLHEGKTLADLNQWRKHDAGRPAPADALGGALDSHDISRVVWLRKNFSPGRYVMHCEMPVTSDADTTSNEINHADLGMVREFVIAE